MAVFFGAPQVAWTENRPAKTQRLPEKMDDSMPHAFFDDPAVSEDLKGLPNRLNGHVTRLSVQIGERNFLRPEAYARAAGHIHDEFQAMGYDVRFESYRLEAIPFLSAFRVAPEAREGLRDLDYRNIVASKPGRSEETIVVGAHYDTVIGSPGADDNASGVAVLLELARLLRNVALNKSFLLVAFANEEAPFFRTDAMGSAHFLKSRLADRQKMVLMISLEMLGYYADAPGTQSYPPLLRWFYPDRADFLAVVGNLASRRFVRAIAEDFRAAGGLPVEALSAPRFVPGVDFSDQLNFWKAGIPAVMLTDTAFYRNPHYHSGRDLPHTLDYEKMAAVTKGLFYSLLRIGQAVGWKEPEGAP